MKKCPDCKEELEDGACKCKVCGSYTTKGLRLWHSIKDYAQFATFIGAILVLVFMLWSNLIMQGQVKLSREAIELTEKSITKEFMEFVEEKRPRIEIVTTKIDLTDTSWVFYFRLINKGFADAEDLLVHFVLKYEDSPNDTVASTPTGLSKITHVKARIQPWRVYRLMKRANLMCLVDVRYTWIMQDLNYVEKEFFLYIYDKENAEYKIRSLNDQQIQQLWK